MSIPKPRREARSPGRRKLAESDAATKDSIIITAEQIFADFGYLGASMRMIAQAADVTTALISYYFGSKEGLFEEVFSNGAAPLIDEYEERMAGLLKAEAPSIREIVEAFVEPQFNMKRSGTRGKNFIRIQARLHNEPEELAFKLRRKAYDDITKRYIKLLERSLPHISPADVNWRVMFVIGSFLYMLSDVSRIEDLSDGQYTSRNDDDLLARMVQFMVAGMEAPTTSIPPKKAQRPT